VTDRNSVYFKIASNIFRINIEWYSFGMAKRYDQYCPMAHALDLVGDRWALLVIRELMHGPKRYTDLVEHLPGIGTNILAARLRELEGNGVVARRTLPPPAASKVYELTDYGRELRPAMRELALWGARSLGPPTAGGELFEGWLSNAMDIALGPIAPPGRFEFRAGPETASLIDGDVLDGSIDDPDVLVEGEAGAIYSLFVDRCLDGVTITGDNALLEALLEATPPHLRASVTT
jgi:DNA-binding HxlR family transcriptional regulator